MGPWTGDRTAARAVGRRCCGRHQEAEQSEQTAAQLRQEGLATLPIVADLTVTDDVHRMIEQACGKLGEIEILVNSAGIGVFGPFHEGNASAGDTVFDPNLKPVFLASRLWHPESPVRSPSARSERCSNNEFQFGEGSKVVKLHRGSEE
jgi:NAD(P)-dependent dehydrogenase (short-subunit alcohol dehydrogenase family)